MEFNEETELTRKMGQTQSGEQMTARVALGWLGVEGSSKKEEGLMGMDNSVVIAGWRE